MCHDLHGHLNRIKEGSNTQKKIQKNQRENQGANFSALTSNSLKNQRWWIDVSPSGTSAALLLP
jgi:hypothetical protein